MRNNVKKMRKAQFLSINDLASKAEVCPPTLYRIEKGEDCNMSTKRKLIKALGVEVSKGETVFPPPRRSRTRARSV